MFDFKCFTIPKEEGGTSRRIIPPVRKRIRRVATAFCVLGFVAVILMFLYLEARFRYDLRARHLRGERLLPEDFRVEPVSDEDNAATYLHEAAVLLKPSPSQDRLTDNVRGRVLVPEQEQYVRELFATRSDAFELIRKARQCSDVNWHIRISSPVIENTLLPHLNEQRYVTNILYLTAVCKHELHDDHAAIGTIRDMLFMARAVDHQPFLVSHLVSIGIEEMAFNACIRIAPSLAIPCDSAAPPGFLEVPRTEITALITELLAEQPRQAALLEAWEYDRMSMIDAARTSSHPWLMSYYLSWGIPELLEQYDTARSASLVSSWHQARAVLGAAHEPRFALAPVSSSFARPIENHLMRLTECRVAATALAIRLYQIDHAGNYPRALHDLVPQYLPRLPLDPFSPENKPLGFVSGDPPSIYSVGIDEIDGHGDRTHAIDDDGIYRPWRAHDAVFPLGGVLMQWDPQHQDGSIPAVPMEPTPHKR